MRMAQGRHKRLSRRGDTRGRPARLRRGKCPLGGGGNPSSVRGTRPVVKGLRSRKRQNGGVVPTAPARHGHVPPCRKTALPTEKIAPPRPCGGCARPCDGRVSQEKSFRNGESRVLFVKYFMKYFQTIGGAKRQDMADICRKMPCEKNNKCKVKSIILCSNK